MSFVHLKQVIPDILTQKLCEQISMMPLLVFECQTKKQIKKIPITFKYPNILRIYIYIYVYSNFANTISGSVCK